MFLGVLNQINIVFKLFILFLDPVEGPAIRYVSSGPGTRSDYTSHMSQSKVNLVGPA